MSVFLAPMNARQSEEFRRLQGFFVLRLLRLLCFLFSTLSLALLVVRPSLLYQGAGGILVGLIAALIISRSIWHLRVKGGGNLLQKVRTNAVLRSLLPIVAQLPQANILLRPCFHLGKDVHEFEMVVVTRQNVSFIRSGQFSPKNEDITAVKATCARLSEQHSLPLLSRPIFLKLVGGTPLGEATQESYWQVCSVRDLGRCLQQTEQEAEPGEEAKTFRILYNLTLPSELPAVPVDGSLPAGEPASKMKMGKAARPRRKFGKAFGKAVFVFLLVLMFSGIGFYGLFLYQYESAEKVIVPARAMLRRVLSPEWSDRLGLGTEVFYNEESITMTVNTGVRLSSQIGNPQAGRMLPAGTELRLIHIEAVRGKDWYFVAVIANESRQGWVAADGVQPRHLLPAGTELYTRPQTAAFQEILARSAPAALISVWTRPVAYNYNGETWSKIVLPDNRVFYVKGTH